MKERDRRDKQGGSRPSPFFATLHPEEGWCGWVGGEALATRKPVNTANVIPACRQLRCVQAMDLYGSFFRIFEIDFIFK